MSIDSIVRSKGFKNFMTKLYGLGAAVVILGALFKINHYPGADLMLIVGLLTEAVIFFFSAFEAPHVEPDWSLVYPELAGMYEEHHSHELEAMMGGSSDKSVTEELDDMLEEAKIGPELIESLGSGLRNLSENASNMSDISDASVASGEYATSVRKASDEINILSENYVATSNVLTESTEKIAKSAEAIDFTEIDSNAFNEELTKVSTNLSALNSVYELQLQNSNSQTEVFDKMGTTMESFLSNLEQSVTNTEKYKIQAEELAKNVEALNNVYGNMLNAMNVQR
ncbi:MAG: gliding motility protein GldL [Bacteroidetes bacterium]|nr:MAG: gliding motility protein GldL [Bacteroidota bacterium]